MKPDRFFAAGLQDWFLLLSNLLIWAACLTAGILLFRYLSKKDNSLLIKVYGLLTPFLLAYGITHLLADISNWLPGLAFSAAIRLLAVLISWLCVFYLAKYLPTARILQSENALIQEIAQRKQAEEKLLQSEKRFKSLVQEGGDLIGILKPDGTYLYISPTTKAILGVDPEEYISHNAFTLVHPDDLDKVQAAFELLQTEKRVKTAPFRFLRQKGEYFWAEAVLTSQLDDPAISGIIVNAWDISERMEQEEVIRQRNAEINKIFDHLRDVMITLDAEGRFVKVSSAALATWGYHPEELIGKQYISLVAPEDKERTLDIAARIMLQGHATTDFENHYVHKNGSYVPMIWASKWDEQDQLMYCIARNATEKIRLEKALHNEQQRFARMFAEAPLSMCILKGPDHVFAATNELYSVLTGRRNVVGKTAREVFPELNDQHYFEWLDRVYTTGKTFSGHEVPLLVDLEGNGVITERYINFIYQPFFSQEGPITGIFYFGTDVTEQVKARKLLEESEEKYRRIVELATEGIWTIDENNNTTFVNQEMTRILGYSEQELLERPLLSFMDEHWQQVTRERINEARQGKVANFQFEFLKKNGERVWTHLATAPITENGVYRGGIAMVTNITERKKEEKLKEVIASISTSFGGDNSLETAFSQTLQELAALYQIKYAEAWVTSIDNQEIKLLTHYSSAPHLKPPTLPVLLRKGEGLPGRVWARTCSLIMPDLSSDMRFIRQQLAQENKLASVQAIPVLFKNEVIAVLLLFKENQQEEFAPIDERILLQLASELQRKKTEDELNRFFHLSPDLLTIAGMDTYLKKVNPAVIKVLGYPEKELLSRSFLEFMHPDDRQKTIAEMESLSRGIDTMHFETRFFTKDGDIRYLVWTATPILPEGLIFALAKDITDIKAVRQEADTYSKRIGVILESITEALFIIDKSFNITYWNSQATKLLNIPREKVIGKNVFDLFPEAKNMKFYQEYHRAMEERVSVRFEEYFAPMQKWFDVSAYPLDEGLSVYFWDITESKENYHNLVKTETDVRNFARQLNSVLEEERSRIAREIHDEFGQQLAGIKMSMSSFKKMLGHDHQAELKMQEIVEDIDNTMHSLRSFATELRPGILDTMGLLPSLEWLASEFEKKTGLTCCIDIEASEQDFGKTFSTCYFRICQEALTNVLKHARARQVGIRVWQENNYLVLTIKDDGIGIVEDKIGNPFSMGLLGMKERTNILGGLLQIRRARPGGTIVHLKAPINAV